MLLILIIKVKESFHPMRFVDLLVLEVNGFYRVSLISHLSCVLIKFVEEIQIWKNVTSQELKVVHKMGKNALVR